MHYTQLTENERYQIYTLLEDYKQSVTTWCLELNEVIEGHPSLAMADFYMILCLLKTIFGKNGLQNQEINMCVSGLKLAYFSLQL